MAAKSLPSLRQFISAAHAYGVREKAIEEQLPSGRLKYKFRYLERGKLSVVVPEIRESERLTEAVFAYFIRGLQLEAYEDALR
jgi:hypothetical protein